MPKIQAISRGQHADKRWQRYSNYGFAAQEAVATLVVQELPKAQNALPIAFVQAGDGFLPAAVQGLKPGQNLFVAPDGRWLANYTPAVYRGYPFCLASTEDGQQVLCVDEESGLISDREGEAFFNDDGTPSKPVADVLGFLTQVQTNRQATVRMCAVLQKHQLIEPWLVKVQGEQGEQNIEGLFRINEAVLNSLPADAFVELRDSGALPMAYCQLLSMQHLPMLGKLAEAHAKAAVPLPQTSSGDLDLEFLNDSGTINFGSLH